MFISPQLVPILEMKKNFDKQQKSFSQLTSELPMPRCQLENSFEAIKSEYRISYPQNDQENSSDFVDMNSKFYSVIDNHLSIKRILIAIENEKINERESSRIIMEKYKDITSEQFSEEADLEASGKALDFLIYQLDCLERPCQLDAICWDGVKTNIVSKYLSNHY